MAISRCNGRDRCEPGPGVVEPVWRARPGSVIPKLWLADAVGVLWGLLAAWAVKGRGWDGGGLNRRAR